MKTETSVRQLVHLVYTTQQFQQSVGTTLVPHISMLAMLDCFQICILASLYNGAIEDMFIY